MTTLRFKTASGELEYEGPEDFLVKHGPAVVEAVARALASAAEHSLAASIGPVIDSLQVDVATLDAVSDRLVALQEQASRAVADSVGAIEAVTRELEDAASRSSAGQAALVAAARRLQETQMSFNLQYLQLQSQMQHENRSYTAISNIMKTKHDTVKNSISNVR
jgi:hypothetical protein